MHEEIEEKARIDALNRYQILDTPQDSAFDDITRLAAVLCDVPVALVSFVDSDRQWFKASVGFAVCQTSRDLAFCDHAIRRDEPLIVPDARLDPRFAENPLVMGPPQIRFYAGVPLLTFDGFALGTLCVIDFQPRLLTASQIEGLRVLSRQIMVQLELRRSEAEARKLALVASRTHNAVIITDAKGRIEWVNEGFTRITGYVLEEAIGRRPGSLLQGPETDPATVEIIRANLQHGRGFDVDILNYHKSGRKYWINVQVQPILDDEGRLVHFMAIEADITERKHIDDQLRLLQAAVENANDVILITEAEPINQPGPRVVYVNSAFTRNTGFQPSEILGKTPRILQGPQTDRRTLAEVRDQLQSWKPVRAELLNYKKDGTEFWVELNIRPVADARGWYTHWVSIQRDITRRKQDEECRQRQSEAALRESRERLRTVVTGAPIVLFALDRWGTFTLYEGRGVVGTGLTSSAVVGKRADEVHRNNPRLLRDIHRALSGQTFRSVTETGGLAFETRYSPQRDDGGEIIGVIGVSTDITDRLRARKGGSGPQRPAGPPLESNRRAASGGRGDDHQPRFEHHPGSRGGAGPDPVESRRRGGVSDRWSLPPPRRR